MKVKEKCVKWLDPKHFSCKTNGDKLVITTMRSEFLSRSASKRVQRWVTHTKSGSSFTELYGTPTRQQGDGACFQGKSLRAWTETRLFSIVGPVARMGCLERAYCRILINVPQSKGFCSQICLRNARIIFVNFYMGFLWTLL